MVENRLFFLLFRNKLLIERVWRLVPVINIKHSTRVLINSDGHQDIVLGKSYSIKNMYLWNDTYLCRFRMIPLLKYLIELPEKVKEELVMESASNCFQLSFPSLQPFLKYNSNYDTYLFFYNKYQHIFQLGKEYLNSYLEAYQIEDVKKEINKELLEPEPGDTILLKEYTKSVEYDVMMDACFAGNLQIVQHMANVVGYKVHQNITLLENACKSGNIELVKWLVEDKNIKIRKSSVLRISIELGRLDMLQYLHQQINENISYSTPNDIPSFLDQAIKSNSLEIIKYIVDKEISIEIQIGSIKYIFESGNKEIFDYLNNTKNIKFKGDVGHIIGHCWHKSCLDHSIVSNNLEFIKYVHEVLVKEYGSDGSDGKDINLIRSNSLAIAIENNRKDILVFLLETVSIKPRSLHYIFTKACKLENGMEICLYLMGKFGIQDMISSESFIAACKTGNLELVKLIVESVDIPIPCLGKINIMELSTLSLNMELLEYLLKVKDRPSLSKYKFNLSVYSFQLLLETVKSPINDNYLNIVKFILDHTPVDEIAKYSSEHVMDLMYEVARHNNMQLLRIYVERGFPINYHCMNICARRCSSELTQYIIGLQTPTDENISDVLDKSFVEGNFEMVEWIHTQYPHLTISHDAMEETVRNGKVEQLKYLQRTNRTREMVLTGPSMYVFLSVFGMEVFDSVANDIDDNIIRNKFKFKALSEIIQLILAHSQTPITTPMLKEIMKRSCAMSSIPLMKFLFEFIKSPNSGVNEKEANSIIESTQYALESTQIAFIKWICNRKVVKKEEVKSVMASEVTCRVWNPEIHRYYQQYYNEQLKEKKLSLFKLFSKKKENLSNPRLQRRHFTLY